MTKKLRKPKKAPVSTQTRTTELIGMDTDGRMYVWDTGEVLPVTKFEQNGKWIDGGKYIIEWRGHAIVVDCSGPARGPISVRFMCNRGPDISMPLREVEAILLGKVIEDPEVEARQLRKLEFILAALIERQTSPDRARGRAR